MSKLTKVLVAVSALSATTLALAGGPDHMAMPAQAANPGHFFVGMTAGLGIANSNRTLTNNTTGIKTATATTATDGFMGGLLGGYQMTFSNSLYLGVVAN